MDRISKEQAIALKAIGYELPVTAYYLDDDPIIRLRDEPHNWNDKATEAFMKFHSDKMMTIEEARLMGDAQWSEEEINYIGGKIKLL